MPTRIHGWMTAMKMRVASSWKMQFPNSDMDMESRKSMSSVSCAHEAGRQGVARVRACVCVRARLFLPRTQAGQRPCSGLVPPPPPGRARTLEKRLRMRPTGVVSKKVTGERTRLVSERLWMTREARSAPYSIVALRISVSAEKAGGGGAQGGGGGALASAGDERPRPR